MAREQASVSFLEKDKDKGKTTPGKEFPPFCPGPWLTRARGDCEVQVRPAYLSLINWLIGQASWLTPVIPAIRRLRQED